MGEVPPRARCAFRTIAFDFTPPREDGGKFSFGSIEHQVPNFFFWNECLVEHFREKLFALLAPEVDEFNDAVIFPSSFAAAKLPETVIDGVVLVRR